jgi:hypothetical protein
MIHINVPEENLNSKCFYENLEPAKYIFFLLSVLKRPLF